MKFAIIILLALCSVQVTYCQPSAKIDSLENIIKNAKEDILKVNCLNEFSIRYVLVLEFEKGLQYSDTVLAMANNINNKKGFLYKMWIIPIFWVSQNNFIGIFL